MLYAPGPRKALRCVMSDGKWQFCPVETRFPAAFVTISHVGSSPEPTNGSVYVFDPGRFRYANVFGVPSVVAVLVLPVSPNGAVGTYREAIVSVPTKPLLSNTVNGLPVLAVTIGANDHPSMTCFNTPCIPFA